MTSCVVVMVDYFDHVRFVKVSGKDSVLYFIVVGQWHIKIVVPFLFLSEGELLMYFSYNRFLQRILFIIPLHLPTVDPFPV